MTRKKSAPRDKGPLTICPAAPCGWCLTGHHERCLVWCLYYAEENTIPTACNCRGCYAGGNSIEALALTAEIVEGVHPGATRLHKNELFPHAHVDGDERVTTEQEGPDGSRN